MNYYLWERCAKSWQFPACVRRHPESDGRTYICKNGVLNIRNVLKNSFDVKFLVKKNLNFVDFRVQMRKNETYFLIICAARGMALIAWLGWVATILAALA